MSFREEIDKEIAFLEKHFPHYDAYYPQTRRCKLADGKHYSVKKLMEGFQTEFVEVKKKKKKPINTTMEILVEEINNE